MKQNTNRKPSETPCKRLTRAFFFRRLEFYVPQARTVLWGFSVPLTGIVKQRSAR
ncbi:MAG: hypothetical protein IJ871_07370 [Ruminococcus sp.]|nr:hypothetical protein [Ruminococcus sp.]